MLCTRFARAIGVALLLAVLPAVSHAINWTVRADGSGDATTIIGGLALADSTDTVTVACGTYFETQIVLKSGVVLTSETGAPDCVTIDCGGNGRGFYLIRVTEATIRGFTVTNAVTNYGGGIFTVSESNAHFIDCVFTGNHALIGGGAYLHHSHVTCTNVEFSNNSAEYFGGGVAVEELSDPEFFDCTIVGNTAFHGGGVWNYLYSYPTFTRCTISGNTALDSGGGVQSAVAGPVFVDGRITGNFAVDGGGVGAWSSLVQLQGVTIAGNTATGRGGAVFGGEDSEHAFTNCILWGNCAASGREAYFVDGSASATFACSDVDTSSSGVEGGTITWSNAFFDDPQFCAPGACGGTPSPGGDYGLGPGSPCLAGNSPGCGLVGALGSGFCARRASIRPSSWGAIKSMYRSGTSR